MMKHLFSIPLAILALSSIAAESALPLADGFRDPPLEAKPKTWLHAMSSNMSREGLTTDLEAIAGAGIGGVQLFNVTQRIQRGNVHYNTEAHRELIAHAIAEADRLGITFDIHNCDGWSSSGGPWVTPEQSMKMVTWRKQIVDGGRIEELELPQPTVREGYYRDIAMLAYPALEAEIRDADARFRLTTSDPSFDPLVATDQVWEDSTPLAAYGDEDPYLVFEYKEPFTARTLFILDRDRNAGAEVLVSANGTDWDHLVTASQVRTGKGEWCLYAHFDPVSSRFFKVVFSEPVNIKEIGLSALEQVENTLGHSSLGNSEDIDMGWLPEPDPSMVVPADDIMDLSAFVSRDGKLNATLPDGKWTLLRIGQTSTGAVNNPASPEGKGLEVDKLSSNAFRAHWDAFIARVIEENPGKTGKTFQSVLIDSYEAGGQNWTDGLGQVFKDRTGYSLTTFLPVLCGIFVENAETTEGVLYDFRSVVADLMVEEYYGSFQELCHENGLEAVIEPYGFGPLKDLDIGAKADVPMGEFWSTRDSYRGLHAARSSARIYGKPIIAAEAFTAHPEINWRGHPAIIKTQGDIAMTYGVNRFVFHRFAHQANTHVEPGMTMNRWGFHFDRTQTWWDSAGAAFFKYLARASFLLQQGFPVSDVLLFEGDGAPASPLYKEDLDPQLPVGYRFDNVNQDVLLNRLSVQDGRLVLPEGTTYHLLALRPGAKIGLNTLLRLKELAEAGVPIIGDLPEKLPGHCHDAATRNLFAVTKTALGLMESVYSWGEWKSAFGAISLPSDLIISGRDDIEFIHRQVEGKDIYFLYNPDKEERVFTCRFRVAGKYPQLWDPMSGRIERLARFNERDGVTELKLRMDPAGSAFVVFVSENQTAYPLADLHGPDREVVDSIPVPGPWLVEFEGDTGVVEFPEAVDWVDHPREDIRYYSGTAIYRKQLIIPSETLADNRRLELDLGQVAICARILLNGRDLGVLWKAPFTMDITGAVVAGENLLEIEVTNLWTNRLIGDERFPDTSGITFPGDDTLDMPAWYVANEPMPESRRSTFTTARFYEPDDPLEPSGLLGPVRLRFLGQSAH
jgi:hypothetical protein